MLVDRCCQALLRLLLPEADRNREGLAIDLGIVTFAFYFQLFAHFKFPTVAV